MGRGGDVGISFCFIRFSLGFAQPHWSRDFAEISESGRVGDSLRLQYYCDSVTPTPCYRWIMKEHF